MPTTADITAALHQPMESEHLDRPALSLETDETWTYRQLEARSHELAHELLAVGVGPGDRVAMLLHNALDYWALYLAITRLRAIAVRVNFRLAAEELAYVLADSGSSVVVMHPPFVERVLALRDRLGPVRHVVLADERTAARDAGALDWAHAVERGPGRLDVPAPDVALPTADEVAMLMYTSGTTGKPKAAVWTHGGTTWFAAMQTMLWGFDRDTVAMTTGPLYHVGSFEDLQLPALTMRGHAVMFRSGSFSAARMLDVLETRRVTDCLIYPFMIYDLLRLPDLAERDLRSLRRIVTGGSEMAAWAIDRLRAVLPDVVLTPVYGLTEGGGIATAVPDGTDLARHPDVVGRPLPMTRIRVVSPDGRDVEPGAVGEVWVSSPSVSPGYWQNPGATAETFVDGWCRSGDLGRIGEAGQLVIAGRAKDMIKTGGENVYPAEVEQVLVLHPAVADAAVIGLPDERLDEIVCAVVVLEPGAVLDEAAVVEHCRAHLAGYKKPRRVTFVEALPRTPSGKVTKFVLRDELVARP